MVTTYIQSTIKTHSDLFCIIILMAEVATDPLSYPTNILNHVLSELTSN
jgi:hypothetical protein